MAVAGQSDSRDGRGLDSTIASPEFGLESTHAAGEPPEEGEPGLEAAETIGRFEIMEVIGRGGMGVVVSAFDPELSRKVAIKVLRPGVGVASETSGRARLIREAQAMAQIAHPNVIAVHDVGAVEDSVYIAMELVPGENLRAWQKGRSWSEIAAVYTQAGRGLAAAHDAELVHRDFKPDNVLIDREGRARVTDFGLASAASEPVGGGGEPRGEISETTPLSACLTRTGALVGTPAYMAPEQHLGEADARADQFAFCVALCEALYGERPFAGRTYDDLAANVLHGRHRVGELAKRNKKVPRRLRAVIERGLAVDAADRYPSMDALIADLERRPGRKRAALAAAGGLVIGGVAIAVALVRGGEDRCAAETARIDAAWDSAARSQLSRAFNGTGHSFAAARAERVAAVLSADASTWRARAEALCREPPADRGERARRELCRDQALASFRALVAELAEVEASQLDGLAQGLLNAGLIDCPEAPGAVTGESRALRIGLRVARVLQAVGFRDEAAARLDDLAAAVEASGDEALVADYLYWRAVSQMTAGDPEAALATAREAESVAARAGRRPTRVRAALLAADVLMQRDLDAAQVSVDRAAGYLEGWDAPVRLAATLELAAGRLAFLRGDWERALERFTRMRDVGEGAGDELLTIAANDGVGSALEKLGRVEEAVEIHDKNLASRRRIYGDNDEAVAQSHNHLASALYTLGQTDKALGHMDKAREILAAVRGEGHPTVVIIDRNRAELLAAVGRYDDALALADRVLQTARRSFGADSNAAADAHQVRAIPLVLEGELDAALVELEAALEIYAGRANAPPPDVIACHTRLAEVLRKLGEPREALGHARTAVADTIRVAGPGSFRLAVPRKEEGLALLALGRAREARALLAETLEQVTGTELRAPEIAEVRFALARALWASGGDKARAKAEALIAREAFANASAAYAGELEAVKSWLEGK
jgi:tetratricopeptide (TPR) repeat protein